MSKTILVKHVKQPTAHTCVHACLAMVTGVPVPEYIERFGDQGLTYSNTAIALVESKLFPMPVPHGGPHPFPVCGVYFISVPSLNLPGKMHSMVLQVEPNGFEIYDPNEGKKDKKKNIRAF